MKRLAERKKRAAKMLKVLTKLFPEIHGTALNWDNPWELLVATVLSAQTTDKQVNKVTCELFKKYKRLDDYAKTTPESFAKDIKSIGLFRNKAKNITASARMTKEQFGGRVPDNMEDLLKLPGVARKTANVILSNAFGKTEGVAVDTHVKRFSQKFDLTDHKDPEKIEKDLMQIVPKKYWSDWTHRLIEYGRQLCPARPHDCQDHPLTKIYPEAAKIWP